MAMQDGLIYKQAEVIMPAKINVKKAHVSNQVPEASVR